MQRGHFEAESFFSALDSQRQSQGLTWKKVAELSGVSASTLTRIAQGKHPDVDSLGALCDWAGLDANKFFEKTNPVHIADPLAQITANLRADKNLTPDGIKAIEAMLKAAYDVFRNDKQAA